jgi:DNA invertase Pin-like site-specific DNA recombinase
MVLRWNEATREQLLQVALDEDCSFDYKYKACSILQYQQHLNKTDYLQEIVYLFSKGLRVPEIARILSITHQHVEKIINQKQLWKTRLYKEVNSIRRIIQ